MKRDHGFISTDVTETTSNNMHTPGKLKLSAATNLVFYGVLTALLVAFAACGSGDAASVSSEGAVRLDGWDGFNNLYKDGRIYFGGQPDEASLSKLVEDGGVVTVVNLRRDEEMQRLGFPEADAVRSMGIRYVSIPVSPDTFSPEDVDRFVAEFDGTDGPVLLHCASSNRVGGMWAAYLVRHRGVDLEEALRQGRSTGLRSEGMIEAVRRVAGE